MKRLLITILVVTPMLMTAAFADEPAADGEAPPRLRPFRPAFVDRPRIKITLQDTALNRILATVRDDSVDIETRIDAISTLALADAKEGVAPLIHIIERQDQTVVKLAAVWALGELGDPIAIPALLRLHRQASGPRPALRYDGTVEFPGIGVELTALELIEYTIGRLGVLQLSRFVRVLSSPGESYHAASDTFIGQQRSALAVIVCVGDRDPAATEALINVAESPVGAYPPDFRETALLGLARILVARTEEFRPVRARDPISDQILNLLTEQVVEMEPGEMRNQIAATLRNTNPVRAVTRLTHRFVDDSSETVRMRAIEVLGLMRTREAVEALVWALRREENPALRWRAAWGLGQSGHSQLALDELTTALNDDSPRVRRAALEAIGHIGGDRAVELISPAIKSEDPVTRASAAQALGRSGDKAAIAPLLELAGDEHGGVRAAAIASLGGLPSTESLRAIAKAAEDEDRTVRRTALHVLSRLNLPAAYAALFGMLDDADRNIRSDARHALYIGRSRHRDAFRRAQVAVIRSRTHPGTAQACNLVERTSDGEVIEALRAATEDDRPAVRAAAHRALRRTGSQ